MGKERPKHVELKNKVKKKLTKSDM
jgi:hypothetical protein